MTKIKELPKRFWDKVAFVESGCWEWRGSLDSCGYGVSWMNGKRIMAHRLSYIFFKGEIPTNLEIDHLCRNRKCVNPEHLELVTHSENTLRGERPQQLREYKKQITHCPKGHPYDRENTYITPNGKRDCRICRRLAYFRWKERQEKRGEKVAK